MFVSSEQLSTTLHKIVETAGFPDGEMFFGKPTSADVQQALAQMSQGQNPEEIKARTAKEVKSIEVQAAGQLKQLDLQAQAATERMKQETQ